MKLFDKLFTVNNQDDYSITGLNNELVSINIYNTFISDNKGILVVTNSTYEANIIYQSLLNYTNKVLFFPMDDFLTSEAIAISPEFMAERLNTLNNLCHNSKQIVVTNLMGALRYLPCRELWSKSKIVLKQGREYNREKLLNDLYNLGYIRETIVNGTGQIGVRGYVIDIFPVSSLISKRLSTGVARSKNEIVNMSVRLIICPFSIIAPIALMKVVLLISISAEFSFVTVIALSRVGKE